MYYILYFQIVIPFDSARMKEGIMYTCTVLQRIQVIMHKRATCSNLEAYNEKDYTQAPIVTNYQTRPL